MNNCPICGSLLKDAKAPVPFRVTDHSVSKETFTITTCQNCELLHTNLEPAKSTADYYDDEDYASHRLNYLNPVHILYSLARSFTLRSKKNLIEKRAQDKTILDYGCGTGNFLSTMSEAGWRVAGYEPSEKARTEAARKRINNLFGEEKNIQEQYSVITLWHALEHTENPKETISLLKEKLSKGGIIVIAVPNFNSADAERYKDHWAAYDVPRHLWHFSEKSIVELASSTGMNLKEKLPMKFDSYYVSLLSEKYLNHGKQTPGTYIKALISGYKSNRKAEKTGQYSSIIYILN
ncbi:MAG: class I SAM-dependent methyltransferase [Cyclobacteriaceae bacterium]